MSTPSGAGKPRILHLHSSFSPGGKELRCVQLINAFGPGLRHAIVSGEPEQMGAAKLISRSISVDYPQDFPSLQGRPWPGRLLKLAKAMKPYDLVLTYNWGAMDAVMAHTIFSEALGLPPLIHHEDGFNEDEAGKLKASRNWYRRIGLGKASGLVVPSERLEEIALLTWQQPIGRVKRIANGIDTKAFAKTPRHDVLRVVKRDNEKWVGTLAGLRPVKNLTALVRAFAGLPEEWQLVIVGEGPEKDRIRGEAAALELSHRVHLPGQVANPADVAGLFDIFALSSHSEQFPISVVEAMAAGIPVAAPAVGDIAQMVASENAPYICAPGDEAALAASLKQLATDDVLRGDIGLANRTKARAEFDEQRMIDTYRRLYASALGQEIR
ncbi:glycosyltransferase family 4 protein [Altererythrobacter arenosus]|uniref:Glycosyltransferase family 4 protein n=1 Tax=Altererythrobacter arenosus TaxID=3032592 RepID=A0ABY8FRB3_9SPHN|nr:glycosyltransferase family 4 protein [Altererythrobacter sp. CAU 1644]WFL77559.1 glycosyltransferase family 4 protein [Altererythrobacter sp. CAU 1644]